jgi:hypothetical protein
MYFAVNLFILQKVRDPKKISVNQIAKERKKMPKIISIIVSCLVLVLYSGCVSQDKYRELETKHNNTQSKRKDEKHAMFNLQAQNNKLLNENQKLQTTIDDLQLQLNSEKCTDEQPENITSEQSTSTVALPGTYSILLSSCRFQESVQKVLLKYKDTDLKPYVVKVDLGAKGVWWRVFSGHFKTRESANNEKNNSGLGDKIVLKSTRSDSTLAHGSENEIVDNESLLVKREIGL